MSYTITEESFDSITAYWNNFRQGLKWDIIFVVPGWLQVWWQAFGSGADLYLRAVWRDGELIGIAPLSIRDETVSIIGSADVCDYLDFIVASGMEEDFFTVILDELQREGIKSLNLRSLRPDSTVLTNLVPLARQRQFEVLCQEDGVSVGLDLPPTWDEYLAALTGKQRHEVKRKLKRLWGAGNVDYRCIKVDRQAGELMDTFLKLFAMSRDDKANFMTARMELFFRSLARTMAEVGMLRFGMLELGVVPVAMIMGFDYHDTMYLYNSAYNPDYGYLSVGLLSKVLCIKESIQRGMKKWDFLKGGEPYKYELGGTKIPLYNCQITIE